MYNYRMRTPKEILNLWEKATKDSPLVVFADECESFSEAMRMSWPDQNEKKDKVTVIITDVLLKDGVVSPIDQKSVFHNRKDWGEHLKRNNCVELGNDRMPERKIQGNFNCRKELTQATRQVLEKQGKR